MIDLSKLADAPEGSDKPSSIYDLLRKRHEGTEWAYMEEVAPRTGGGTRYADAVAVNLWSSRGHEIIGYEVKVSRSDWLRELRQPAKAEESVFAFCDRWYLVAERGIASPDELPKGWGLMERFGSTLRTVVQPARLEAKPVSRAFFASLMRRSFEGLDRRAQGLLHDKEAALRADYDRRIAEAIKSSTRRHEELSKAVSEFEDGTGLKLVHWNLPVADVRLAQLFGRLRGYGKDPLDVLSQAVDGMERAAQMAREALAAAIDLHTNPRNLDTSPSTCIDSGGKAA